MPTDYPSTSRPSPGLYAKDNAMLLKVWACQFSVPSAGHWTQEIPWEQAMCSLPRGALMPVSHKDSAWFRKSEAKQQHCCGNALGTFHVCACPEGASVTCSIATSFSWEQIIFKASSHLSLCVFRGAGGYGINILQVTPNEHHICPPPPLMALTWCE